MNASSYIYGAYLNFVTNGGGGGTESVDASAQTGDIVAILVCLLACLMVVAAGLIFGVMYKRSKITCANHSRFGALTQTIINNKIIVAAILAVCVIAIAVGAFTARALADVNDDPEKPAAPPYSQVVANGDASNGEVSVDTIHIVDSYAAQYNKVPEIKSFSINAINGVDALKLGNWHVSIDGFEVYSGPATMNGMDISYFPKNLNTFDIDISADGVSSDVFDQINGVKGLAVEFRVDSFRDVSEIPEAYDVGLTLKENTWESPKSITIAKEAEFKEYIESKGWTLDADNNYVNNIPAYTPIDEILEPWNYALESGMLVNDTGFEFYRWNMNNNVTPSILLSGQFFNPVWFPAENTVNFSYNIGQDCKITDYGKSVIEAHGWTIYKEPSVGGEGDTFIQGTISNLAHISEINSVLNADCFYCENAVFAGWDTSDGYIFEITGGDSLNASIIFVPVYVVISGMVNDELGNGMPNISVCFEDLNADRRARLQARQTGQAIYSTVTDASGNYFLLVAKGINGILRFGATIYDTTDNTWAGESMLIENISERTIPNVTVYTKGIIEVTYSFPSSAANSAKIDFGQMKFYTSDGQKVFYGLSGSGQANTAVIETYAHISGKIVIEVPSLYGEVNVSDSGDIANPAKVNLQINYKTPEMSDCRVTGTAYLLDENGKTPIPNAILRFHVRDPYTKEKFTITVTADADGKYVLNGFQDAYISQVDCLDADGETILHQRHYDDDVMMFGDAFVLDVTFEQVTPGNNLTAG